MLTVHICNYIYIYIHIIFSFLNVHVKQIVSFGQFSQIWDFNSRIIIRTSYEPLR